MATVREELSVIASGLRGSAVSGGHFVRLVFGYNALLTFYLNGMIGNRGRSILSKYSFVQATLLNLPTIAGGFGLPNVTVISGNTSGNRDVEKMATCRFIARALRDHATSGAYTAVTHYMKSCLLEMGKIAHDRVPDRLTIAHPNSTYIGPGNRDELLAEGALELSVNPESTMLINHYLAKSHQSIADSFPAAFIDSMKNLDTKLPTVIVDKALASDESTSVILLVKKIASSRIAKDFLKPQVRRKLSKRYWNDGRMRLAGLNAALSVA